MWRALQITGPKKSGCRTHHNFEADTSIYIVPSKFNTFFQTMNCIPVTPPDERELDRRNRNCHDSSWQWTEPCRNAEADRSDRSDRLTISHFPLGHKQPLPWRWKSSGLSYHSLRHPQADWPQVSVCSFSWVPIVAIGYRHRAIFSQIHSVLGST